MKKISLYLIISLFFLLCSCNVNVNYDTPESVIDNIYEIFKERNDYFYGGEYYFPREQFFVLGKYNEGYLIIRNPSISNNLYYYAVIEIEGVELTFIAYFTCLFYYIDYTYKRDKVYIIPIDNFSNNNIYDFYKKGFLNSEDLLDIKWKLDSFKDAEIPYYVTHHFPVI